MNNCGIKRHLRQAAKRYQQGEEKTASKKLLHNIFIIDL
jgi:hypothetical protein